MKQNEYHIDGIPDEEVKRDFVMYNGALVHKNWPKKIEEEQNRKTFRIEGKEYDRVKWGDEQEKYEDHTNCGDCGVLKGQYHVAGCDLEECPKCGWQRLSCDCKYEWDDEKTHE